MFLRPYVALVALAALGILPAEPAAAHTFGAHGAGFAAGLGHPFAGIDHVLAMIAVGILAARRRGLAILALPAAFVGTMVVGAAASLVAGPLPLTEEAIALSLLGLGACTVLGGGRLSFPAIAGAVAFTAFAHGAAHGAELPEAASPWAYALGFALATAALHGVGLGLGRLGLTVRGASPSR
jgi:urease accessory protein